MASPYYTRILLIVGLKPVDEKLNEFTRSLDLGIDGAYVPFSHKVTLRVNYMDPRQLDAVKEAYERAGCRQVRVFEEIEE